MYGLILIMAKYIFGVEESPFLGYLVNKDGIKPLPENVAAIYEYKLPESAKQFRRFLGVMNFYRLGLPHTSELQAPLNDLFQGNLNGKVLLIWNKNAIDSFEKLKKSLAETAFLSC